MMMNLRASLLLATFSVSTFGWGTTLWNNGPFVTGVGNGFGGANTSEWTVFQTPQGPIASNIGCNHSGFRVIEDFTVPTGQQWKLNSFAFYGFRSTTSTVSPPPNTFTSVRVAIHTVNPSGAGAVPAFGDFTTERFQSASWTGTFRIPGSDPTNRQRPIMEILADAAFVPVLSGGTYWVEYGLQSTSASSAVFAVGVSPVPNDGNALQRSVATGQTFEWAPVTTSFQIRGEAVPEPATLLGLAAGLSLVARRLKSRRR